MVGMALINKDKKADILKAIESGDTSGIKEIKKQPLAVEPATKQPAQVKNTTQTAAIRVSNPQDALIVGSMSGNLQEVKSAIASGARVNVKDKEAHWTALMWACDFGHIEVARLLIDSGANLNARDHYDYTALMRASDEGRTEVVKFLVGAGADTEPRDKYGKTALMMAFKEHHKEAAEALLDAGANLEATDRFGRTLLLRAVSDGWAEGVKLAVAHGANLRAEDLHENTAWGIAMLKKNNHEIVEILMDAGV